MKKILNYLILIFMCLIVNNRVYAEEDLSKASWWIYDHTNFEDKAIVSDKEHKYIEYHRESQTSNYVIDRHIEIRDNGKTLDFKGYGVEPFTDFIYYPSNNPNEKVFSLNINKTAESTALWHTFQGLSIFFNTNITGNYIDNSQIMNTYAITFTLNGTYLIEYKNLSTKELLNGDYFLKLIPSGVYYPIIAKINPTIDKPFNKIKLVTNKDSVKMYAHSTVEYYAEELSDWNLMEWELTNGGTAKEISITNNSGSYGFGIGMHYRVHNCPLKTNFIITDLSFPVELDFDNPISEPENESETPNEEEQTTPCQGEDDFCSCLIRLFIFLGHIMSFIKISVPVIIILLGSIDLIKAMIAQKDDEIKKAKNIFIKRLIYAVVVFFIISIVSFLIGLAGGDINNRCFKCVADVNSSACDKDNIPICCR